MATKYRTLCLAPARATPGMTLAKAIHDRDGAVLLASDTVLDLDMLERLIRRGIATISVQVPDGRNEETITRELLAVRNRIEKIFRGPSNAARDELRATVLEFRIETTR